MALLVLLAGAAGAGRVARGVRIVRTGVLGALLDTAALTGTGVLQLLGLLLLLAQRGDHGLRLLRYGLGVLVLRGVLRGLRSLGGRSGLLRFLGVLRLVLRLLGLRRHQGNRGGRGRRGSRSDLGLLRLVHPDLDVEQEADRLL